QLCGLHALLPIDEISMMALPDVAQRGWLRVQRETEAPEPEPEPEPPPDCEAEGPFETCPPEETEPEKAGSTAVVLPEIPQGVVWQLLPPVTYDASGLLEIQRRSEEHTSELQSRENLVCRLLLEKKKQKR